MACDSEVSQSPVILHKHTEISVVPKERDVAPSGMLSNDALKLKETRRLQFECLRSNSKPDLSVNNFDNDDDGGDTALVVYNPQESRFSAFSVTSFFSSWLSPSNQEESFSEEPESFSEIYDFNFDSVLRVLPYSNPKNRLPGVIQATTVFISASTYFECCDDSEAPPCFVGVLQKYSLPEKRQRKGVNDSIKNDSTDNSPLTKNGDKSKLDSDGGQKPFDSLCVTVMVVKSAEEDEFKLPTSLFTYKNAIVVPKELKRALNIKVTSLVHLKSVHVKPLLSYKLIFHPVITLVSTFSLYLFLLNFLFHIIKYLNK